MVPMLTIVSNKSLLRLPFRKEVRHLSTVMDRYAIILDEVNRLRPHDEYHCHFQERLLCHNNSNNNTPTMTCWRFSAMKPRLKQRKPNCSKKVLPMRKSSGWPQTSSRMHNSANMDLTATAAQSSCKQRP